ncbi:transglutaminase domain-containing protein [Devosia sp.]|uniref:transglutaminase family protein n=1 Tax=Devosia sp. TaxID=1871048 RepID=UPI0035AE084A
MLYDVRLELHYDYVASVHGDRHLVRVTPVSIPGVQRVIAAALSFSPRPEQETTFTDFFGNIVTTIAYSGYHDHLDVKLTARVQVEEQPPAADLSPTLPRLAEEIAALWSLAADAPHHFLAASPRVPLDRAITGYARDVTGRAGSVKAAAMELCLAIHRDFKYDKDATKVDTGPSEAFALKRGVCQDFAHVMIAGLRGIGIPAGYVSGFLRTIPPKGKPRLAGADAMHAWVRVWCGPHAGWLEFDPTNAMPAGVDHITIGYGRDYSDVSPIVGVLRTSGGHHAKQSVDVIRVE